MATRAQIDAATAVLGMSWEEITEQCRADLGRYGVLPLDRVNGMTRVPAADIQPGDLVAVFAHQRYRAARVWKVGSKNVSAFYLAPSHLDDAARYGRTLHPNNITAAPSAVIARRGDV
jgi:hypothetical protein